jgi:histone H3/H4
MNRESFGLEMPDHNESTFVMNLQPQSDGEPEPVLADDDTAPMFDLEANIDANDEEGADDMEEENEEETAQFNDADATQRGELSRTELLRKKRKRGIKVSAFGVEYPSLPPAVIKRIAQSYAQTSGIPKTKISPDTLAALSQATDWFFEQLGDSLQAYAKHAGRKTIDESDVITLMRRFVFYSIPGTVTRFLCLILYIWYRQRQIGPKSTPFSLAQRHLPRELLQGLRMAVPVPVKKRRRANVDDDDDG